MRLRGLLIALTVAVACVSAYDDLITRDTIQGELVATAPVGWELYTYGDNDAIAHIDVRTRFHGERSVSLFALNTEPGSFASFRQAIKADYYAGQRVRFRAYLKTSLLEDWCGLWMRADSGDRKSIAFDNMYTRQVRGTTDWTQYDVVLDIPKSAARIYIGVLLVGTGQLWIDNCTFEIVGHEVATTGDMVRSTDLKTPIPPDLPPQPQNLDFEGEALEYLYP